MLKRRRKLESSIISRDEERLEAKKPSSTSSSSSSFVAGKGGRPGSVKPPRSLSSRKDSSAGKFLKKQRAISRATTSSIIHAATTLAKLSAKPRSSSFLKRIIGVFPRRHTEDSPSFLSPKSPASPCLSSTAMKLAELEDISSEEDDLPTAEDLTPHAPQPGTSRMTSKAFAVSPASKRAGKQETGKAAVSGTPKSASAASRRTRKLGLGTSAPVTATSDTSSQRAQPAKQILTPASTKKRKQGKQQTSSSRHSTKKGTLSDHEASSSSSARRLSSSSCSSSSASSGSEHTTTATAVESKLKGLSATTMRKTEAPGKSQQNRSNKKRVRPTTTFQGKKEPPIATERDSDSYSESGNDSDSSLLATSDALPRLTRSQHRLLLGDIPPGTALLTAATPSQPSATAAIGEAESAAETEIREKPEEEEQETKRAKNTDVVGPKRRIKSEDDTILASAKPFPSTKQVEVDVPAGISSASLDSASPAEPVTTAKGRPKPNELSGEPLSPSLTTAVRSQSKLTPETPSTVIETSEATVAVASSPLGPISSSSPAPHCTTAALASLPASPSSLWESASLTAAAPASTAGLADQEAPPGSSRASNASICSSSTEPMRERSAASLSPTPPQHLSIHEEATLSFACDEEGEGSNVEHGVVADGGLEAAPQLLSPISVEEAAGVSDTSSFDDPSTSGKIGARPPGLPSTTAPTLTKSPRPPYQHGRRRRVRSSSSSVATVAADALPLDEEKAAAIAMSSASSRRAAASSRRQALRQAAGQQVSATSSGSSKRDSPAFGSPLTSNAPSSSGGQLSSPSTPACYSTVPTSMGAAVAVAVSCTSTLSGLTPLPTTATAATSTAAVTTATVATPAAVPLVRRFGGPFFPIANFDSMPSDIRCQKLQQSLCQILDSWRSARQYLKDLDQRVTRSQRMRAKRHTELGHHERAVARSPSPLMPSAPPSVSSPPLLSQ